MLPEKSTQQLLRLLGSGLEESVKNLLRRVGSLNFVEGEEEITLEEAETLLKLCDEDDTGFLNP